MWTGQKLALTWFKNKIYACNFLTSSTNERWNLILSCGVISEISKNNLSFHTACTRFHWAVVPSWVTDLWCSRGNKIHNTQQKQWLFPNVFRFVHSMCTNQCTKLDKLLVCKLRNCLFATTAVSTCANYLQTHHL